MRLSRLAPLATAVFCLSSCGGGSYHDPFAGNYNGSVSGASIAKGQSGSTTVQVVQSGSIDKFSATLSLTNPTQTITFTGSLTQSDVTNQTFATLETGGPYDGQTLKAAYNPNVPKSGETTVYIYEPGSKTSAFVLVLSKL